jgi:hypothetical protein
LVLGVQLDGDALAVPVGRGALSSSPAESCSYGCFQQAIRIWFEIR